MVGLGQPVLDAVCITKHGEHMDAPPRRGPETVFRQIGELDANISANSGRRSQIGAL